LKKGNNFFGNWTEEIRVVLYVPAGVQFFGSAVETFPSPKWSLNTTIKPTGDRMPYH